MEGGEDEDGRKRQRGCRVVRCSRFVRCFATTTNGLARCQETSDIYVMNGRPLKYIPYLANVNLLSVDSLKCDLVCSVYLPSSREPLFSSQGHETLWSRDLGENTDTESCTIQGRLLGSRQMNIGCVSVGCRRRTNVTL